jgi:hypothetical protein
MNKTVIDAAEVSKLINTLLVCQSSVSTGCVSMETRDEVSRVLQDMKYFNEAADKLAAMGISVHKFKHPHLS